MLMTLREALLRGKRRPRRFGAGSPTTYRGDGYEFVELRGYVPGDDVRRIDWAATARSGELQTRVVLEDVALTLAAFVDDSPSMRVGRKRALLDAADEAIDVWFGAALRGDRCTRIPMDGTFTLERALRTAHAMLQRGSALLAVSDWYELTNDLHDLLAGLAVRCDCTALLARDPWYDGLPLSGFVRIRGAEGGVRRMFIGARERASFLAAVHAREAKVRATFDSLGWRTGLLYEGDGEAGLLEAFSLRPSRASG